MEQLQPIFAHLLKWRALSQAELEQQPAFSAVLKYLTSNGAPFPAFGQVAAANGQSIVTLKFGTVELWADSVVTSPEAALSDLRRLGAVPGPDVYVPFVYPEPVKQQPAPTPVVSGPVVGGHIVAEPAAPAPVVAPTPAPVAPRVPATQGFDPAMLDAFIAYLKSLGFVITPPGTTPPPVVTPPAPVPTPVPVSMPKSLKVYGKSGKEILSGSTVTYEEINEGRTVFTGNPGDTVWVKNWYNGTPLAGGPAGIPQCLMFWMIGPDGKFEHRGFGLTGPSETERQGTERCQFFLCPATASVDANAVPFADFTLTMRWNTDNGLLYERTKNVLGWNIHLHPVLTVVYTKEELGNPPLYDAVKFAYTHGLPIPPDPGPGLGTPVA